MWRRLAQFVLRNRLVLLIILFALTGLMAFYASKIKLSYEFSKAIPTNNSKYQDYLSFKEKFGDDGNLLVIGVQTDSFFTIKNFGAYIELTNGLKKIPYVENVLSIPNAVNLIKDTSTQKLNAVPLFPSALNAQQALDSSSRLFYTLPFYNNILYNPCR